GLAADVLRKLRIYPDKIRLQIEQIVQSGPVTASPDRLPQTPRAKKVIEYAVEEGRQLNHDKVGTEHLLLGLLREEEGVAAQVLLNLGLRIEDARRELLHLLGQSEPKSQGEPGGVALEYDLYVPLRYKDGGLIETEKINRLRKRLTEHFGGVT